MQRVNAPDINDVVILNQSRPLDLHPNGARIEDVAGWGEDDRGAGLCATEPLVKI
jgi:hypothetical protein